MHGAGRAAHAVLARQAWLHEMRSRAQCCCCCCRAARWRLHQLLLGWTRAIRVQPCVLQRLGARQVRLMQLARSEQLRWTAGLAPASGLQKEWCSRQAMSKGVCVIVQRVQVRVQCLLWVKGAASAWRCQRHADYASAWKLHMPTRILRFNGKQCS